MAVRWNVTAVSKALDEMDEMLRKEVKPALGQLQYKISETTWTPNLPGYMLEPLDALTYDIAHAVDKFHGRIDRMKEILPKDDSARRGCEKYKKRLPSVGENQLALKEVS